MLYITQLLGTTQTSHIEVKHLPRWIKKSTIFSTIQRQKFRSRKGQHAISIQEKR